MTHDQNSFKPRDPGRINPTDPIEMQYWCKHLGCTEHQLEEAMSRVGDHVAAIHEFLESRR
jgi:hypothetical protein